jgi:tRNA G10  N-methylase Trm11
MEVRIMLPRPIHPFPARMAPHIALKAIEALTPGSTVLDPMMGSGTVVRVAAEAGHRAFGRDIDPLAVLMTRVWTAPIDPQRLRVAARELVDEARELPPARIDLPWIDDDAETAAFSVYWFAEEQRQRLRQLSSCLHRRNDVIGDALRVALSRIIITKNRGASLAHDVSHSRPHKVAQTNTYRVFEGFLESVHRLACRLEEEPPRGWVDVSYGDARATGIDAQTVDAVITSPPYLNAIDYIRGHRLALIWFGYRLRDLRAIRQRSIGAERAPDRSADPELLDEIFRILEMPPDFPRRERRVLARYVTDLDAMLREVHRVLKCGGIAVFVIGNSYVRGSFVRNSRSIAHILRRLGFDHVSHFSRPILPSRRYLPPPAQAGMNDLEHRMRREVVLTYVRR